MKPSCSSDFKRPPGRSLASKSSGENPASSRWRAAISPATPAPMMMTFEDAGGKGRSVCRKIRQKNGFLANQIGMLYQGLLFFFLPSQPKQLHLSQPHILGGSLGNKVAMITISPSALQYVLTEKSKERFR